MYGTTHQVNVLLGFAGNFDKIKVSEFLQQKTRDLFIIYILCPCWDTLY